MDNLYEVKNPTSSDLKIMRFGVMYELPANGELKNLPEDVARFWGETIHTFLRFTKMPKAPVVVEKEVKTKEKTEVIETEVETEVEKKEDEIVVEKEVKVAKPSTKPKNK